MTSTDRNTLKKITQIAQPFDIVADKRFYEGKLSRMEVHVISPFGTYLCDEEPYEFTDMYETVYEKLDYWPLTLECADGKMCLECVRFLDLIKLRVEEQSLNHQYMYHDTYHEILGEIQHAIHETPYLGTITTYAGYWFYTHYMSDVAGVTLCGEDLKIERAGIWHKTTVVPSPSLGELAVHSMLNNKCFWCEQVKSQLDSGKSLKSICANKFSLNGGSEWSGLCYRHINMKTQTWYPQTSCVSCQDHAYHSIDISFIDRDDSLCIVNPNEIVAPYSKITIHFTYPLSTDALLEFETTNPNGFSRREFISCVGRGYRKIYDTEHEAVGDPGHIPGMCNRRQSEGPYGIWGHDMDNLVLHSAKEIDGQPGHYTLGIDS